MVPKICSIDGCANEGIKRGWCNKHYKRWMRHGDPLGRHVFAKEIPCSADECSKPSLTRGWCGIHYNKWRAHGDPNVAAETHARTPQESFALRVKRVDTCLVWTGWRDGDGYGRINAYGRKVRAHRFAWEQVNGPIPEGLYIDHICRNTSCCDVEHLRLTTPKQNSEHSGLNRRNTSGYKGVTWRKNEKKWLAQVNHAGKAYYAGYFDTAEEAGEAARSLRLELFTHNDLDRVS